jgi:uncharacterized protein YuzE
LLKPTRIAETGESFFQVAVKAAISHQLYITSSFSAYSPQALRSSQEPDVIVELDEKKEIMGLEIWNAKKSGLLEKVAKVRQVHDSKDPYACLKLVESKKLL